MKEKIIEILLNHSSELKMKSQLIGEPEIEDWLWSGEFKKAADEIVKLFAVNDVSGSLPSEIEILEASKKHGSKYSIDATHESIAIIGFKRGVKWLKNWRQCKNEDEK